MNHFDRIENPFISNRTWLRACGEATKYISNDSTMDALKAWLRPPAQPTGYVIPYKMQRFKERKTALLKMLAIRLPENGFRNSFTSYFI